MLALDPLPDGRSFDGLSYVFTTDGPLGPRGSLHVGADGKVSYGYETVPFTGSGGTTTQKVWTIPTDEAAALFRELVAGGLLDLRDANRWALHTFHITSGEWQLALAADVMPEKVAVVLRPLLTKAHPELWGEKAPESKPVSSRASLTKLRYEFAPQVSGDAVSLDIARDGLVSYRRQTDLSAGGRGPVVGAEWRIPIVEATALLDALVVAGVLGLEHTGGGKFPSHGITAHAGRWRAFLQPKELPEAVLRHLRPLLEKADPVFWKPVPRPAASEIGGAVLVGALGIQPLPDTRQTIESLSFMFSLTGSLNIAKDGQVTYRHSTAPFTGSGGIRRHKTWQLARDELTDLFAKMVADGVLEGGTPGSLSGNLWLTSGRWSVSLAPDRIPEQAMRHLRPLLERAHPELWGAKVPAPGPRVSIPQETPPEEPPPPGVLWRVNYYFAPKDDGDRVLLFLGRDGAVRYQRYPRTAAGVATTSINTSWMIPAKDAAAILDALAANGVCDLEIVGRDKYPVHRVEVGCGPWWSMFHTKPLPEKFMTIFRPLMKKADPEFWK